ncbi:DUF1659 domain-containing protein [Bacillus sp. 2205SS5-2]|uniref:DUF1659 domain-containing protein n=1 Tax=Bacillus sp. 2205SS5-2 TaxID=3109031 RepID=UPI003004B7A5
MATADLKDSRLRLEFDHGVDGEGKPVFKGKSYSNIRLDATPDEIYASVQAIAGLSSKSLYNVEKNDAYDINE